MANTLENSPFCRRVYGMGVFILVPIGFPLSSMSTTLLESNLGVMWGPGILCPTIKAFFFSPLIARRILSPTLPTPVLLYTWMHFGGRWYGVFPKALLSTTRTRVSFCIAWHAAVILGKNRKEWERDLPSNPWGARTNPATGSCHCTNHSEDASNIYIPHGWHIYCIQCALWKPDATLSFAHSSLNVTHKTTILLWNMTKRWLAFTVVLFVFF